MRGAARAAMIWATLAAAPALAGGLDASLRIDGTGTAEMEAGAPARWSLSFTSRETGEPVRDFAVHHEKPMHLVVVSDDLEHFAHLHPSYEAATGAFTIVVNGAAPDADNADAPRAVPKGGVYHLYAEVKPTGGAATTVPLDLTARGEGARTPLVVDPVDASGRVTKFFTETGAVAAIGAKYKAQLAVSSEALVLTLQRRHHGTHYVDVRDVEPWLGMSAHGVLIAADGATAADKRFYHLHAGDHDHDDGGGHDDHGDHDHGPRALDGGGPGFAFPLTGAPSAGVHKLWIQVKHDGRILTMPFVLRL